VLAAPGSDRGFNITASATLSYDDNVFRTPDGVTRPGRHRSDTILTPSIGVGFAAPVGPVQLALEGDVGYLFHRRNPSLDRETVDAALSAASRLMGCDVGVNSAFGRAQSDLADLLGDRDVNIENRFNAGANLLCGDDIGLRPGISYNYTRVTNSAEIRKQSNYSANTYTASLGYSRPSFGLMSVYGSYRDGSYPNRRELGPGLGANDRVRVYSTGLSYSRSIGSRLSGQGSIGYMKVKPRNDSAPDYSGLTYSGEIGFQGGDRISGSLGFARTADQSNLFLVSYTISTRYDAAVRYALGSSMSLRGGAAYTRRNFKTSLLSDVLAGRTDTTKQFDLGLDYSLGRAWRLSLLGTHTTRDSELSALNYSANRIAFTAGLQF